MAKIGVLVASLVLLGAGCTGGAVSDSVSETEQTSIPMGEAKKEGVQVTFNEPIQEETTSMPSWDFPGVLAPEEIENKRIRISTDKGQIVFDLFANTAPKTVSNFVYLTKAGYYNGVTFHRREEGFVIQGGDPKGNGTGGPGYEFEDELKDSYTYERGIVAMANRGPNTNGSQFFIMLGNTPLPKAYSIFGRVVEGMDVVDKISVGDVMSAVVVEDVK